jgi:hypothetical protein
MDETGAADLDFQRALASARLPSMKPEIAFHWSMVNMPDMVSDTSKHNIGLPDAMGCYTAAGYMYSRELGQCIKPGGGGMVAGIEPAPPSLPSVFAPVTDICDFGAAYFCSQTIAPATVSDGPVDSFASILDMSGIGPMIPGGSSMPASTAGSMPKPGPGQVIPPITMPVTRQPMSLAPGVRPVGPPSSSVPAQLAPGVRPVGPPSSSVPAQLAPGVRPVTPLPIMEPAYQTISTAGELLQWENTETGLNRFAGNLGVAMHTYK